MRIGCSGRAYFNYFTYPPKRGHSNILCLLWEEKLRLATGALKIFINLWNTIIISIKTKVNNKLFLKHLHTWYESNINRHPVSCFLSNNPVILTVSSDQKLCKTLVVKNRCFVFVYLSKFLITYKQHIELCLYVSL